MTGGWFVSNCQGEFGGSAAGTANPRAFFFGGSGFNGRNACALTRAAQVNNISTTTVFVRISGLMISLLPFSSAEEFRNADPRGENPAENNPSLTQIRLIRFFKIGVALSRRDSPDNRYQEKLLLRSVRGFAPALNL